MKYLLPRSRELAKMPVEKKYKQQIGISFCELPRYYLQIKLQSHSKPKVTNGLDKNITLVYFINFNSLITFCAPPNLSMHQST